jgi:hypothetical protein
MSDIVVLEIIKTFGALMGIILTPLLTYHFFKLKHQINSRMDEIIELNKVKSKAEGKLEEKTEEAERQKQ